MPGSDSGPPPLATIIIQHSSVAITSYDFGKGAVALPGLPVSFTILNAGSNTVTLGGSGAVQVTGDVSDFKVTAPATSTLAAGASTTFAIAFCPKALGPRTAAAKIIPASGGKEASFTVSGTGETYNLVVAQNGETVSSYDFSGVMVGSQSSAVSFTITNKSTTSIDLQTPFTISGANPSDFAVSAPTATTLAANDSATFTISFTPGSSGARSANVAVSTTTAVSYNFAVSGTGNDSYSVAVTQGVNSVTPFNFGAATVGSPSAGSPVTFTITNQSTTTVTLQTPFTISGPNASDFTVSAPATTTLAKNANTTFTISFTPGASGARSANITVSTTSGASCPFTVSGTGNDFYKIVVTQGGNIVTNFNFGIGTVGSSSSSSPATFTIMNQSTTSVTIDYIGVSGANASDFVPTTPVSTTLAKDASTTFSMTFTAGSYGARSGHVTVHTPVTQSAFDVSGTGTSGVFKLEDVTSPANPILIPYDCHVQVVTGATNGETKCYRITNTGSTPLSLLPSGASVVITGDTTAITLASPQPGGPAIPASGTQTFSIQAGNNTLANRTDYSVTVTIQTSDASNATFVFHIDMNYYGNLNP